MAKVIFVLQRRAGLTREQALAQWSGEQHVAIVGKLPGLTRYVQNHVGSAPAEPVCDGIGELWFPNDELMNAALSSPEMAAAVEDAKRFLDMEPDEVFTNARAGDERCAKFARLWHRALAAGTAISIHLSGPGRFFVTGPNARYVDVELLSRYVYEMVKMSPLQGSVFEVTPVDDRIAIIGAAVNALGPDLE